LLHFGEATAIPSSRDARRAKNLEKGFWSCLRFTTLKEAVRGFLGLLVVRDDRRGETGSGRWDDLHRPQLWRAWGDLRRSRLQHQHDRLPGGADRSVL